MGPVTIIAIIVSLFLPSYYKSAAIILPETEKSKLTSVSGLADLAALAGVNVGGEGSLSSLYPTIIRSQSVLRNVIFAVYKTDKYQDSVNLIQYWGIDNAKPEVAFFSAYKRLSENIEINLDGKTSVLTLSLETKEPKLSADILNKIVEELDRFMLTRRTTNATEQRKFIEGRLAEVNEDLSRSENSLKEFRERNQQVHSPALLLEQGRLERALQINTTLFIELKKQFELAKIEEVKNLPIINVLDWAQPAVQKDRPNRTVFVIFSFFIIFIGSILYEVGNFYFKTNKEEWLRKLGFHSH